MQSMLNTFVSMPMPLKIGLAVVTGGLAAALFLLPSSVLWVVFIGVGALGGLLFAYRAMLRWRRKRRAAPMERDLAGNSSMAPQGVTEPARRARLDDLRKNFETGVEKFRSAGKNLYSLPWYALVGEPGSGKTEAIRHCNVGFPPGLQDQLQGAGGTLNMNWWFTNHAVILDTAGRLMFEEVEPGSTSEWQEFLKLLKKNRPNCPINGMLLVIPADSLIRDTADGLERKGGRIAEQLDSIQRILGVRFPVFVVVTKCDLINGFREFFDQIHDPQLQHQILGWSNPADLDEPFRPELVEQHLKTVQTRLRRRRLGLMLDPCHSEDPVKGKRISEVDALYALPDALVKIAPRLRRYLEMIFVAGEWSAKPLFLRGIYFTSAMREGAALDADLAEAMGISVEALPEGRVWERDRAFFLRDLFMTKVFKERGLVTHASSTKGQQTRQRNLLYGTAAVGILVLGLFTWLGVRSLSSRIGEPQRFWAAVKGAYVDEPGVVRAGTGFSWPIVDKEFPSDEHHRYAGDWAIEKLANVPGVDESQQTAATFPEPLVAAARADIGVPLIFLPAKWFMGDWGDILNNERVDAARAIFEASVLRPLISAAQERLAKDAASGDWSLEATGAFAELLRLEVTSVDESAGGAVQVDPLLAYVLKHDAEQLGLARKHVAVLQAAMDGEGGLYATSDTAMPISMAGWRLDGMKEAATAFATFVQGDTKALGDYGRVKGVLDGLDRFADAEQRLQEVSGMVAADPAAALAAWNQRFTELAEIRTAIGADWEVMQGRSLSSAFNAERAVATERLSELHNAILKVVAPAAPEGESLGEGVLASLTGKRIRRTDGNGDRYDALQEVWTIVKGSRDRAIAEPDAAVAARIKTMDTVQIGAPTDPSFVARFEMYERVNQVLSGAGEGGTPSWGALAGELEKLEESVRGATTFVEGRMRAPADANAARLLSTAMDASKTMLGAAARLRRAEMVGAFLRGAPTSAATLGDKVAAYSTEKGLAFARPPVPMTAISATDKPDLDRRYQPEAARAVLGDCAAIGRVLGGDGTQTLNAAALRPLYEPLRGAADDYADAFVAYWTHDILERELAPMQTSAWPAFIQELRKHIAKGSFTTPLKQVMEYVEEAVGVISDQGWLEQAEYAAVSRQVREAKQSLEDPRYEDIPGAWWNLDTDIPVARRRFEQAMGSPTEIQKLIVYEPDDYAQRFWAAWTFSAMQTLATAGAQADVASILNLKQNVSFPMERYRDGKPAMTADQAADARKLLDAITASGGAGSAPGGERPAAMRLLPPQHLDLVEKIQGRGNLGADKDWVEKVAAVARGLSADRLQPYTAEIYYLGKEPSRQANRMAADIWPDARLTQGRQAGDPVRVRGTDEVFLAEVKYPGEASKLEFFLPGAEPKTLELPTPWAPIYLLDKYAGTRSADGKTWEVEVRFPDEKDPAVVWSFWVKVVLAEPLPELEQWVK